MYIYISYMYISYMYMSYVYIIYVYVICKNIYTYIYHICIYICIHTLNVLPIVYVYCMNALYHDSQISLYIVYTLCIFAVVSICKNTDLRASIVGSIDPWQWLQSSSHWRFLQYLTLNYRKNFLCKRIFLPTWNLAQVLNLTAIVHPRNLYN